MIPLIGGIGWQEILLVAAVIFILFGASRIPAAFRSLGEGIRSFKDGLTNAEASEDKGASSPAKRKASRAEADEAEVDEEPDEVAGKQKA